jgi:hypothetical protein
MQGPVYAELAPVRRRQQSLLILWTTSQGLLVGAAAGVVLGLARLAGWAITPWQAAAVLLAGPALGFLVGLAWRRSWHEAAAAVDVHYELKDRAVTALAFLAKPAENVFHELQVRDTAEHLATVRPGQVVPLRVPRSLYYAVGGVVAALALLVWPLGPQAVEAGLPEPLPEIVAQAEKIAEDLKEFEEIARQENNKELEKLVQELKKKVEEMKQPGVDEREALAKLSEMQAAIAAQQAQYNVGLVDGQLQALGEAMTAAQALDAAGKALQDGKYDKAAKELEEMAEGMEAPQLERREAKALEEKLKQAAKNMADAGLGQMSEAASDMAEGGKGGKGKFQKATKMLAKEVRGHSRRKRINSLLAAEVDRLQENKEGSSGPAKGKRPYKSLSPSSNWGMETSGNVIGEKTNMLSQRQLEQLTGMPGDGPSDVDTTHSAEGRQQAARKYKDVYQKYRRLSEAVLDSEPIPLGHRQTIRKYFELIRPQNADLEKPAAGKAGK